MQVSLVLSYKQSAVSTGASGQPGEGSCGRLSLPALRAPCLHVALLWYRYPSVGLPLALSPPCT